MTPHAAIGIFLFSFWALCAFLWGLYIGTWLVYNEAEKRGLGSRDEKGVFQWYQL